MRTGFDKLVEAFRRNALASSSGLLNNSALPIPHSALASLVCLFTAATTLASPAPSDSANPVWFTQIGAWHIHIDSSGGESYISHDSRVDAAYSGEATAFVRQNFAFHDIRLFSARLVLSSSPALAGLVLKGKSAGYYFLLSRNAEGDSLHVLTRRSKHTSVLGGFPVARTDSVQVTLYVDGHRLRVAVGSDTTSMVKPRDFDSLTTVGFECVKGIARVYSADIDAANRIIRERFRHATLVNLHLDKSLSRKKSPQALPRK